MKTKTFETKLEEKIKEDVTFKKGTSLEKIQSKIAELALRVEDIENATKLLL